MFVNEMSAAMVASNPNQMVPRNVNNLQNHRRSIAERGVVTVCMPISALSAEPAACFGAELDNERILFLLLLTPVPPGTSQLALRKFNVY